MRTNCPFCATFVKVPDSLEPGKAYRLTCWRGHSWAVKRRIEDTGGPTSGVIRVKKSTGWGDAVVE